MGDINKLLVFKYGYSNGCIVVSKYKMWGGKVQAFIRKNRKFDLLLFLPSSGTISR